MVGMAQIEIRNQCRSMKNSCWRQFKHRNVHSTPHKILAGISGVDISCIRNHRNNRRMRGHFAESKVQTHTVRVRLHRAGIKNALKDNHQVKMKKIKCIQLVILNTVDFLLNLNLLPFMRSEKICILQ